MVITSIIFLLPSFYIQKSHFLQSVSTCNQLLLTEKQCGEINRHCPTSFLSLLPTNTREPYSIFGSAQLLQPVQREEIRRILVNKLNRLLHPPLLAERRRFPYLHFFPARLRQDPRIKHLSAREWLSPRRCASRGAAMGGCSAACAL